MLNNFFIEEHVKNALNEDIGFGDITTDYLTNEDDRMSCTLNTRVDGILCGRNVFEMVFKVLSPKIDIKFYFKDGNLTWFSNFKNLLSRYLYYYIISPIGKNKLLNLSIISFVGYGISIIPKSL